MYPWMGCQPIAGPHVSININSYYKLRLNFFYALSAEHLYGRIVNTIKIRKTISLNLTAACTFVHKARHTRTLPGKHPRIRCKSNFSAT